MSTSSDRPVRDGGGPDGRLLGEFALAILLVDGRYALQLRDEKPTIASPGHWALFGGRIEDGETPEQAVVREVFEELCLTLPGCRLFEQMKTRSEFMGGMVRYWFFEADVTAGWGAHQLREGQATDLFAFEDLARLKIPRVILELLERHHRRREA